MSEIASTSAQTKYPGCLLSTIVAPVRQLGAWHSVNLLILTGALDQPRGNCRHGYESGVGLQVVFGIRGPEDYDGHVFPSFLAPHPGRVAHFLLPQQV